MMNESPDSLAELLRKDKRYKIEAYAFVFDALRYGHETLGLGSLHTPPEPKPRKASSKKQAAPSDEVPPGERHLTGQELCEAIRLYALEQFGYMAMCVLNSWGIKNTGDFGEIVFNLIRVGEMRKTDDDRREDFEDVFDFEKGLNASFKIRLPEAS